MRSGGDEEPVASPALTARFADLIIVSAKVYTVTSLPVVHWLVIPRSSEESFDCARGYQGIVERFLLEDSFGMTNVNRT